MKTGLELVLILSVPLLIIEGCGQNPAIPPVKAGPKWVLYNIDNSPLPDNNVNTIVIDHQNVWIGSDGGASNFNHGSWHNFEDELKFNSPEGPVSIVRAITIGKDGSIWFGLFGGGLIRFDPTGKTATWINYIPPKIPSYFIYSLATATGGEIYAGMDVGVLRYVPGSSDPTLGTWIVYNATNSLIPTEIIHSEGVNQADNSIWIGTSSQGMVTFDGDESWNITAPNDQPLPILSISFTTGNIAWIGTYGDWAYRFDANTSEWVQYTDTANGAHLPDFVISATAIASDGAVWFGTTRGLTRMKGTSWSTFTTGNSPIPSDTVKALTFDLNENLWIGTPNGVAVYNSSGVRY
ncbi:MAG TPA: two-component regulator propeller domain-containing protein [Bacteroidota bacterium]|nr:two-component regulator propeller domain-containing protein [Bacteroidota bacterium]